MYEEYLPKIEAAAKFRNLSPRSKQTYITNIFAFLKYTGKDPEILSCYDVQNFLLMKREAGVTPNTCNLYLASIHFFFRYVLHKLWDPDVVPRMLVKQRIPRVLSLDEIEQLIAATDNIKYKAIISLLYGSGLRVSELIRLNYADISRKDMRIHVKNAKNMRDRYTVLSTRSLDLLTKYWYAYDRPKEALFLSQCKKRRLSKASVEAALRKIGEQLGFPFRITPHMLRHSFATHLLEAGTDIRYIQTLLGHKTPRSTETYLHLSNKIALGVRSPFDRNVGGQYE